MAIRKRLVFSGAGQLGVAFIGTIRVLESHYNCNSLSKYYGSFEGTSSGALCATMLSIGLSSLEMLFYYQQVPDYAPTISNLASRLGFSSVEKTFHATVTLVLKRYGIPEEKINTITFLELFERTKIRTVIGLTIIGPVSASVDASHESVPDWPFVPCLYSSMAIPGVFEPVAIETPAGTYYGIDGAISCGFRFPGRSLGVPFNPRELSTAAFAAPHTLPEESRDDLLGVLIQQIPAEDGYEPGKYTIWKYFNFICEKFFHYLSIGRATEKSGVIVVHCESGSGVVYRPTPEKILTLIRAGEKACTEYLNKSMAVPPESGLCAEVSDGMASGPRTTFAETKRGPF